MPSAPVPRWRRLYDRRRADSSLTLVQQYRSLSNSNRLAAVNSGATRAADKVKHALTGRMQLVTKSRVAIVSIVCARSAEKLDGQRRDAPRETRIQMPLVLRNVVNEFAIWLR